MTLHCQSRHTLTNCNIHGQAQALLLRAVVTETSLMSMDVCVYSMSDHMSKSNCIHKRAFIGMYWQQVNEHAVVCLCFQAVAHVFEWIRPVGMGKWGMPCVVWQLAAPIAALSEQLKRYGI